MPSRQKLTICLLLARLSANQQQEFVMINS